jgi:TRAP-type C4-dicarboxylate transport system permease small subunit
MESPMKRLASSAVFVMTIVGVLVVVALILSTGLGAVGRYLGLSGITWSFEMVGILFLWTTAIGAVLSEVAGENVSIDGNWFWDNLGDPSFQVQPAIGLTAGPAVSL